MVGSACTTSKVKGASLNGVAVKARVTQVVNPSGIWTRPLRCKRKNSQILIGESQSSLAGLVRALATRGESRFDLATVQIQICVSRRSFNRGLLPNRPGCRSDLRY